MLHRTTLPSPATVRIKQATLAVALALSCHLPLLAADAVDGITFAVDTGKIYIPLDEAARKLRWRAKHDEKNQSVRLNNETFAYKSLRQLTDGTKLVSLAELAKAGTTVTRDKSGKVANVGSSRRYFTVKVGAKKAEVNLAKQQLQAWQGKRLILQCRVSSGRNGSTPSGSFSAGPYKARKHYSSRYNNAPMPWSVQVNGHIFIHGFTSVPKYPASHGCIRVPLNEGNPARFFYEWISVGTPIRVVKK